MAEAAADAGVDIVTGDTKVVDRGAADGMYISTAGVVIPCRTRSSRSLVMYLGVLGFGLGPIFQRAGEGSYLQFMAPGIMCMTILLMLTFSAWRCSGTGSSAFSGDAVAPVPRFTIMVGRTVGGATVALFQGLLVFGVSLLAGFRPATCWSCRRRFSLLTALVALVFSAMGTIIGSSLRKMQGFHDHELPRHADLLSLGRAVSVAKPSGCPHRCLTPLYLLSYGVDALRGVLTGHGSSRWFWTFLLSPSPLLC